MMLLAGHHPVTQPCTLEVAALYTFEVGVIKTCFSTTPTNFLLTNYSFGKSVRTSTLCMTQVIFQQLFTDRLIHCITTPVGQTFTYTQLTVPLNSLENSRK